VQAHINYYWQTLSNYGIALSTKYSVIV